MFQSETTTTTMTTTTTRTAAQLLLRMHARVRWCKCGAQQTTMITTNNRSLRCSPRRTKVVLRPFARKREVIPRQLAVSIYLPVHFSYSCLFSTPTNNQLLRAGCISFVVVPRAGHKKSRKKEKENDGGNHVTHFLLPQLQHATQNRSTRDPIRRQAYTPIAHASTHTHTHTHMHLRALHALTRTHQGLLPIHPTPQRPQHFVRGRSRRYCAVSAPARLSSLLEGPRGLFQNEPNTLQHLGRQSQRSDSQASRRSFTFQ